MTAKSHKIYYVYTHSEGKPDRLAAALAWCAARAKRRQEGGGRPYPAHPRRPPLSKQVLICPNTRGGKT